MAIETAAEFFDVALCAFVKYSSLVNVSMSNKLENAISKALDSDCANVFNCCCALSRHVDIESAKKLSSLSLDIIIAPNYDDDALLELKKNQNTKIIKLKTPYQDIVNFVDQEIKITPFGALIQQKDNKDFDKETFKVVSKKKPTQQELEDMIFAFKVVKHAISASFVVAKDLRTLGICSGQQNQILALETALSRVCDSTKDSIIATDCDITSSEIIQLMIQNRVNGIIQPAGNKKDKELIALCDKYDISMVTTAITHRKH